MCSVRHLHSNRHTQHPQAPCMWLGGLQNGGQTDLVFCPPHTCTHPLWIQAWPCYPAFSSSQSLAAEECFGCKGHKVEAAEAADCIYITCIWVHLLNHPPPHHGGSQPGWPQQSVTPKLPLRSLIAQAAACQPAPSPSPSPCTATTQHSISQAAESLQRERNTTYLDWRLLFFKGIKGEFLFDFPAALDRCLWETVPEA